MRPATTLFRLRSFEKKKVEEGLALLRVLGQQEGLHFRGGLPLPTTLRRWTILRSPHVNKKARDQFEIRTYTSLLALVAGTRAETAGLVAFLEKVADQLPGGLTLKATRLSHTDPLVAVAAIGRNSGAEGFEPSIFHTKNGCLTNLATLQERGLSSGSWKGS